MPTSLTDQNISNTYKGLLHAQGTTLPTTSQVAIYDGNGRLSSLSVGASGYGITVTGTATVDSLVAGSTSIASLTCAAAGILAPNTPKAWVLFSGNDGTIRSQYNVATVTRAAAGDYTVTFATPMVSSDYVVHINFSLNNTAPYMVCAHVKSSPAPSTTTFGIKTYFLNSTTPTPTDFVTVGATIYHA